MSYISSFNFPGGEVNPLPSSSPPPSLFLVQAMLGKEWQGLDIQEGLVTRLGKEWPGTEGYWNGSYAVSLRVA